VTTDSRDGDEDAVSAGYESMGDCDSLGSLGELVEGPDANWDHVETDTRDD
jgi:hypothetical protein